MSAVDLSGVRCPACRYQIEATTALQPNTTPSEGAVSICIKCATVGVFTSHTHDGKLILRRPTNLELSEIMGDPKVTKAILAIHQVHGMDAQ